MDDKFIDWIKKEIESARATADDIRIDNDMRSWAYGKISALNDAASYYISVIAILPEK